MPSLQKGKNSVAQAIDSRTAAMRNFKEESCHISNVVSLSGVSFFNQTAVLRSEKRLLQGNKKRADLLLEFGQPL